MTAIEKKPLVDSLIAEQAEKLARHEIGWWQAHHRKERAKVVDHLSDQFMVIYGVSKKRALRAAQEMLQAADWHDTAEKWEDFGDQKTANKQWAHVRKHLVRAYKILLRGGEK